MLMCFLQSNFKVLSPFVLVFCCKSDLQQMPNGIQYQETFPIKVILGTCLFFPNIIIWINVTVLVWVYFDSFKPFNHLSFSYIAYSDPRRTYTLCAYFFVHALKWIPDFFVICWLLVSSKGLPLDLGRRERGGERQREWSYIYIKTKGWN